MDLQQLRYIIALAQELNFHKAAQKVGIAQPTLSLQIKKLEEELGEPLFERSPRAVRLTEAGERFLPFAATALETIQNGVSEVKENQKRIAGKVKIAFIPTIGPYLLPAIIKTLKIKAPELILELYEETTSMLVENLKSGKFDLGLLALPMTDNALVTKKLAREEFYLAASKKDPLSKKKQIKADDLNEKDFLILQDGHCFRDNTLDFCKMNRTHPRVVFEGSSLTSLLNLVETGDGITIVPKSAAQSSSHKNLRFIPFCSPQPFRDIGLIWRMSMPLNKAQKFFIQVLEDHLKKK